MKRYKMSIFAVLLLTATCLVGCNVVSQSDDSQKNMQKTDVKMFSDWFDYDVFKEVPAMLVENTGFGLVNECGVANYTIDINNTSLEDYEAYLNLLEENDFIKYADNGAEGLVEAVYTATYTKDNLVVTVCQVVNIEKTYITACFDLPLSDHLVYREEYEADMISNAKTTLHMREMYEWGNSFLIQLKNGHFVVHDGGLAEDAKYLVDYLEKLAPNGEKPVVEGWFFSHAHQDHVELMATFAEDLELANRLYVEGFYYSEPSNSVAGTLDPGSIELIQYINSAPMAFRTVDGEVPKVYRPQTGQRYYFCDITIDVVYAQELMVIENITTDLNETSTWFMHTMENQKFLLAGDADEGSMRNVMRMYNKEYFVMDVLAVMHHGINVYDFFTAYCTFKTALYPNNTTGSRYESGTYARINENEFLKKSAVEYMSFGEGTVVLTFPYKVGTAETLPPTEWIYNPLKGIID